MRVDIGRIERNLNELNKFNTTVGNGCTRFSYTEEDKKSKDFLIEKMKKIGMDVWYDSIGNLHGRLNGIGENKKIVLSGSHIDTVPNGGRLDGNLGVIGALEVGKVLFENKKELYHDYEVVVFVEEEGAHFGTNLIGSKAIVGKVDLSLIEKIKNKKNETMYELMKKSGFVPENIKDSIIEKESLKCMVELHIEQGRVLDIEKKSVGIVKGIVGLRWLQINIIGESNHAGATPMGYRKDPMVQVGKIAYELPEIVKFHMDPSIVATVGKIECFPNQTNVIAKNVQFTVDLRGIDEDKLDLIEEELEKKLKKLEELGYSCEVKRLAYAKAVKSCDNILNIINEESKKMNIKTQEMYSGANHDTSLMGEITNVAMIFVPSIDGRSHCKEEHTHSEDIENGCNILLNTIYRLCMEK